MSENSLQTLQLTPCHRRWTLIKQNKFIPNLKLKQVKWKKALISPGLKNINKISYLSHSYLLYLLVDLVLSVSWHYCVILRLNSKCKICCCHIVCTNPHTCLGNIPTVILTFPILPGDKLLVECIVVLYRNVHDL